MKKKSEKERELKIGKIKNMKEKWKRIKLYQKKRIRFGKIERKERKKQKEG